MDNRIVGETEATVNWRGRICEVDLNARYFNNRPVIRLVDRETREFVATATADLPEVRLEEDEVLIRDYSKTAGILAALQAAGIVESTGRRARGALAYLDICRLLVQPPREPAAEPEGHPADLASGRVAFLHHLGPDGLLEDARATLVCLAETRGRLDHWKAKLRQATEALEIVDARLVMTPEYAAGKNAEIRAAWLKQQRIDNANMCEADAEITRIKQELAEAEATYEALVRDWQLSLAEIRLASARLMFLAGVEP